MTAIQRLQDIVADFQRRKFPDQPMSAKLVHCQREINEILEKPDDLVEWADAFILFLGAAAKAGYTTDHLIAMAHVKLARCELRKWGPPDAAGVCHHLEETETRLSPPGEVKCGANRFAELEAAGLIENL